MISYNLNDFAKPNRAISNPRQQIKVASNLIYNSDELVNHAMRTNTSQFSSGRAVHKFTAKVAGAGQSNYNDGRTHNHSVKPRNSSSTVHGHTYGET